jgi:hypothetical protein
MEKDALPEADWYDNLPKKLEPVDPTTPNNPTAQRVLLP